MNVICLIMLFDAFVYLVLTWYIETVWPGNFKEIIKFDYYYIWLFDFYIKGSSVFRDHGISRLVRIIGSGEIRGSKFKKKNCL